MPAPPNPPFPGRESPAHRRRGPGRLAVTPDLLAALAGRLTARDRWLLRMIWEHRVLTTTQMLTARTAITTPVLFWLPSPRREAALHARLAPMATAQLTASQVTAEQNRDLTPGSATVTVRIRQTVTTSGGRRTVVLGFAGTLTSQPGTGWAVYDIEPADAGNAG
jgi:hypothetical protein